MEIENNQSSIGETKAQFDQLNKVTPLSKYLALALFVVLPFVGAYVGYKIATGNANQGIVEIPTQLEKPVIEEIVKNDTNHDIDAEKWEWASFIHDSLQVQFKYPKDWIVESTLKDSNLEHESVAIVNPKYPGKPNTDTPSEIFSISEIALIPDYNPCPATLIKKEINGMEVYDSGWTIGFADQDSRALCLYKDPQYVILVDAFAIDADSVAVMDEMINSLMRIEN